MTAVCVCPECGSHHAMMLPKRPSPETVTISLAQHEAYRAAAKALKRYHHPPSGIDAPDCPCCNCEGERAIAGLRAVGILEEE